MLIAKLQQALKFQKILKLLKNCGKSVNKHGELNLKSDFMLNDWDLSIIDLFLNKNKNKSNNINKQKKYLLSQVKGSNAIIGFVQND